METVEVLLASASAGSEPYGLKRLIWMPGENTTYQYKVKTKEKEDTFDDLDVAIQVYNTTV